MNRDLKKISNKSIPSVIYCLKIGCQKCYVAHAWSLTDFNPHYINNTSPGVPPYLFFLASAYEIRVYHSIVSLLISNPNSPFASLSGQCGLIPFPFDSFP